MMTTTVTKERLASGGIQPGDEAIRILELRLPECRGSLRVEHVEGLLILSGQVSSYYSKQIAQESVRDIPDVLQVENRLKVVR